MDKMQDMLRFVVEHHPRIFKISYVALILPIVILSIIPLLSPIFLQLPNADVVEFQLRRSQSVIDIGYYNRWFKDADGETYFHACISTVGHHATGKTLARQWGKAAAAGPRIYERLVEDFDMTIQLQRDAMYPGLLIAAAVLWTISIALFHTGSYVKGNREQWVLRACKGFAVIASLLFVVATTATTAGVYPLVQYFDPSTGWDADGRMGAILAVQWAAAGAMAVHTLLAFAVTGDMQDKSEGHRCVTSVLQSTSPPDFLSRNTTLRPYLLQRIGHPVPRHHYELDDQPHVDSYTTECGTSTLSTHTKALLLWEKCYLKHADDKGFHVLVDEDSNITGLIDW
ncbi:hypothetical protein M436DRAFT_63660 [Aureobasidium namibiae CBS 147.97]|uniref:Uncharacterized protein n=1 Tax=Aureobasidium namibiae CBS 147.97 TaxID=1043004 RepID=A0A074WUD3_9PEZI